MDLGRMVKQAMLDRGIKNARSLHYLTVGVSYNAVCNCVAGKNVDGKTIGAVFKAMGYTLKAVPFKGEL